MITASSLFETAAIRAVVVTVLSVCLAACAAPELAYQKLGWLASWKVGQYVELDAGQEREFDAEFHELWDWHRVTELGSYGQDLRELARATQQPMSSQEVQFWALRAEAHSERVLKRAIDPVCTLVSGFDDAQRDSVLKRIAHDIDEDAEEYLDASEPEIRRQAHKRMRKSLERWVGELDDRQQAMLDAWSQTRPRRYREWIEERRRWHERLGVVLHERAAPNFCENLHDLVLRPRRDQDADLVNEANARTWFEFLASFSATLDERQRKHLRDKLVALASDLEALQRGS